MNREPELPIEDDSEDTYRLQDAQPERSEPELVTAGDSSATGPVASEFVFHRSAVKRPQPSKQPGHKKGAKKKKKSKHRRGTHAAGEPLLSAIWYPVTGGGILVLLLYSVLLWAAPLVPIGIIAQLLYMVVLAYVGLLFLETANFTLEGIPQPPRLPDLSWENFSAGVTALIAVLIAMLPSLVAPVVWSEPNPVAKLLLLAAGMYYLPMAFIILADLESEWALNPLLVWRGIAGMLGPYLGLVTLAAAGYVILSIGLLLTPVPRLLIGLPERFLLLYVTVALLRAIGIVYLRRRLRRREF